MKIWLPYTQGGSGTDVFTEALAAALRQRGHEATTRRFAHNFQYAPWLLKFTAVPDGTDIVLANSWNAFVFKRPDTRLVAVEHLLVLDPALAAYRSNFQAMFHRLFVSHFEHASQRAADQVVAVSEYTGSTYRDALRVAMPKVIANGIDTDFFHPPATQAPLAQTRPLRLLFVGNMSKRKGADMLPGIMALLGNGFELSYTLGLRAEDPFPDLNNVRRLGRLDAAGVRAEYQRADLLLFPTRLEGLPLVAMEAMACGTPVVASDTASLPEVVDHEETGILCAMDDCAAFAAAIKALQADPARLEYLAANARRAAQQRFSIDRMTREYIDLFVHLLQGPAVL